MQKILTSIKLLVRDNYANAQLPILKLIVILLVLENTSKHFKYEKTYKNINK